MASENAPLLAQELYESNGFRCVCVHFVCPCVRGSTVDLERPCHYAYECLYEHAFNRIANACIHIYHEHNECVHVNAWRVNVLTTCADAIVRAQIATHTHTKSYQHTIETPPYPLFSHYPPSLPLSPSCPLSLLFIFTQPRHGAAPTKLPLLLRHVVGSIPGRSKWYFRTCSELFLQGHAQGVSSFTLKGLADEFSLFKSSTARTEETAEEKLY